MAHHRPCAPARAQLALLLAAATLAGASPAAAQQVRIRQLNDIAFGTIGAAPVDLSLSENLCVYSSALSGAYTITARGSGTSSAFALANGSNTLPYEAQWSFASGSSSGTALSPGVALAGTTGNRTDPACNAGNHLTATLIVVLRANAQQSAPAGSYNGTLTLLVSPN